MKNVLQTASSNLKKDGFMHQFKVENSMRQVQTDKWSEFDSKDVFTKAISIVRKIMFRLHHRLYRGDVYKKVEAGSSIFMSLWG